MRLQEEYIKRHNLKYSPIYHVRNANIILKSQPHIVINIKLDDTSSRPAHYIVSHFRPNHKSYLDGNYFFKFKENVYQYEEYTNFIMRLAKASEALPIKFSQIKLALWEIFLYCFDGWIVDEDLKKFATEATRTSCPIDKRVEAISSFLNHLQTHYSLVWSVYNDEFRKYETEYAEWLVELIDFSKGLS